MCKRLLCLAAGILFFLASASITFAQQPTTTTQTTAVQNADGSWTVIEYPVGKEVMVNLTPTTVLPGAGGHARILRAANGTTIILI